MNDLQHIKSFWHQHFKYRDVVETIPKYKVVQLYRHLHKVSNITNDQFLQESGRLSVKTKKVHRTKTKYFLAKPISRRAINYLAGTSGINQHTSSPMPAHPQLHMDTPMIPLTSKVTTTTSQAHTPGTPSPTMTRIQHCTTVIQVSTTTVSSPCQPPLPHPHDTTSATHLPTIGASSTIHKSAQEITTSLKTNKKCKGHTLFIGTYNVHTLLDNRMYELSSGCNEQHIDILGVQEHRWTTTEAVDIYWTDDKKWAFLYTSALEGQGGMGILITNTLADKLTNYHKISHRIMVATFHGNPKLSFITAHAPHGGYPLKTREEFFDKLAETIHSIPLHNILIVGGDLNAQLGRDAAKNPHFGNSFYYDITKKESNGMLLSTLCKSTNMACVQTFFEHPRARIWTHRRPNGDLEQLDHILINRKWWNSIRNCRAYDTVEVNSDHRILVARVTTSLQHHQKPKLPCKRNWSVLKDEEASTQFNDSFKVKYAGLLNTLGATNEPTQHNVQTKYNAYVQAISDSAKVLPTLPRKHHDNPVSRVTDNIRKHRNQAKKYFVANNTPLNKITLNNLNCNLRNSYKQDMIRNLEKELESLRQADQIGDTRTTWSIINNLSGKKTGSDTHLGCMTKEDGSSIAPENEIHEWMLYFQDLLTGQQQHIDIDDLPKPADTNLPIPIGLFTKMELDKALQHAKPGKAPGIDGVMVEVLKHGGTEVTNVLLEICNLVYQIKSAPHQWKESILNPIFKKGKKDLMTNYRGISLMSVAAKLFNRLILYRLRPVVDPLLRDNQAGFRTDRSCIDQIHILRRIIEGAEAYQLPLVIAYVDFKKAFDSINRTMMFAILRHYGVPHEIVMAIKCLYDQSMSCVRMKGKLSEFFEVLTGVMQGDVLAPFLFIIVMDYVIQKSARNHGFTTHQRRSTRIPEQVLNELAFADDIANLSSSVTTAQQQLQDLSTEARKVGLEINSDKTQYNTYNLYATTSLQLHGEKLKINDNFRYLGAHMKDSTNDIETRKGMAMGAFWKLKKIWDNDIIPIQLKIKIFKTAVLSIFLYACETWVINDRDAIKINTLATKCYRYILHIQQEEEHVPNAELYNMLKEQELMCEVKRRQLSKIGHFMRKPPQSLVNTYALYVPAHGTRRPGRQKRSYQEMIASTINFNHPPTETEIRQRASNRVNWKETVKQASQR